MPREPGDVPRAVLDTNVLVAALLTPNGASAQLLIQLRAGAFELVTSPMLLAELDDVLRRPKFRRYIEAAEVDSYVEMIRRESVVVDDPAPSAEPIGVDPDDAYLIDLARAVRVDTLVTGDRHLLDLADVLPVRTPREFLESLG